VQPRHRWPRSFELLALRFGYEGPVFPPFHSNAATPFDAAGIIEKAWVWYNELYASRLNGAPGPGSIGVMIRGDILRARVPRIIGEVVFEMDIHLERLYPAVVIGRGPQKRNILAQIEGLTPAFAASLSGNEQRRIADAYLTGVRGIYRLDELEGHGNLDIAREDYETSVDALLKGNWRNAHWSTSACVEKLLKGILASAGIKFPTSGEEGHDLIVLGKQVSDHLGRELDVQLLKSAQCATGQRYAGQPVTRTQAYSGHVCLLKLLCTI